LYPSDRYVLLPDDAHPTGSIVHFKGEKADGDKGGIYYLDVKERHATLLEDFFPEVLEDGGVFVERSAIQPPGVSESENRTINLQEMARSQDVAAAVALKAAGYEVTANPNGALITAVAEDGPSIGKLKPTDVIVSVDGRRVRTPNDLRRLITRHRPGESVRLGVRGDKGLRTVTIRTIPSPSDRKRALIGVLVAQASQIKLPFPVTIDTGDVGGPSAGLAFALEVLEKLGRDVDHGYKVAATGEIFLDGSVGPIGGVRQKIYGARKSNVDIMLVPRGENAEVARKYAGPVRVIPVDSFQQALRALATLPPKS
jgi:PDZ domain-containing protein